MKRCIRATLAVSLVLTGCLWVGRVEAQGVSGEGHFTLPYPVEWAGRTLTPGRYTVTVMPRLSATLFIKVSGQGHTLLLMPAELSSRDSGEDRLVLVSSRGRRAIRTLQVAGLTATFPTPRPRVRSTERGPALAAADIGTPEFVPLDVEK